MDLRERPERSGSRDKPEWLRRTKDARMGNWRLNEEAQLACRKWCASMT